MNWMKALSDTYDACIQGSNLDDPVPLLPICHTTNQIQIEVTLDAEGRYLCSEAVPKEKQTTVIPCTEKSGGRTDLMPHPFADKLQYLAVDYVDRQPAGSKKSKSGYDQYVEQLEEWGSSKFSNRKVLAVLDYVKSGSLIGDLIESGIIIADDDGICSSRKSAPDAPLFSICKIVGEQLDAFVRWRVDIPGDKDKDTWKDSEMHKSWIGYYLSTMKNRGLCYISGKEEVLAKMHPKKIRNQGDRAKLISSNDPSGFVFRGRFEKAEQACDVGYETTQKAHSALRWLIGRQGYRDGDFCIVSWTLSGDRVSSPADDYSDILGLEDSDVITTGIEESRYLNNRICGYNSRILNKEVMIMAMDSATPGRLSILMYRECLGEEFVERLEKWHSSCAWKHSYASRKSEDGKPIRITFVGAPSPKDIAKAAYGERADSKLISYTIRRILPCILDGSTVPKDIVDSAVRRASNPVSMETWEWMKTLSIACSVFRQQSSEEYSMVLDKERKTRDYLYGRLLAIADLLESTALYAAKENRQTTAIRLMQRFSEFPYSTWRDIELALVPYMARLGSKSKYYEMKIAEIMDLFDAEAFVDNSKLSGEFLLAYHSQKEDQYRKKEKDDVDEGE